MDLRDAGCQDGSLMQLAQDLAVMNTWFIGFIPHKLTWFLFTR